jgi:hypothetical protein
MSGGMPWPNGRAGPVASGRLAAVDDPPVPGFFRFFAFDFFACDIVHRSRLGLREVTTERRSARQPGRQSMMISANSAKFDATWSAEDPSVKRACLQLGHRLRSASRPFEE